MELQSVGRRKWNWGKIGLSALVLGVMLVIVADSCNPQNEDEWMYFYSDGCTCQGTTLSCVGHGDANGRSASFTNSKYCDQQSLKNQGFCTCTNTDLVCDYLLSASVKPQLQTPNPKIPTNDGEVHFVFADSLLCGGSGGGQTPEPTQELTVTSSGQGACLDPCDPNVSGSCEAGLNCEPQSQNSTSYVCWNNSICNPTQAPTQVVSTPVPCVCGDGVCEQARCNEFQQNCPADCGSPATQPPAGGCTCGNGVCEAACGEDVATCPADCGAVPGVP